jgi:hypothetical protein
LVCSLKASGTAFYWQFPILQSGCDYQIKEHPRIAVEHTFGKNQGWCQLEHAFIIQAASSLLPIPHLLHGRRSGTIPHVLDQVWGEPSGTCKAKTPAILEKMGESSHREYTLSYLSLSELVHWFCPFGLSSQRFLFNETLNTHKPGGSKWITCQKKKHWGMTLFVDFQIKMRL